MKLLYNISIYSFLILSVAACGPNFFDAEIELPTPEHDPVLAVSSFITSSETGLFRRTGEQDLWII